MRKNINKKNVEISTYASKVLMYAPNISVTKVKYCPFLKVCPRILTRILNNKMIRHTALIVVTAGELDISYENSTKVAEKLARTRRTTVATMFNAIEKC